MIDSVARARIIEDRLVAASGMSKEDISLWLKNHVSQVLERMRELKIPEPWIIKHPNVVEIERDKITRGYRVLVSQGTGFKKKPQLLLVMTGLVIKGGKIWFHVSVSSQDRVPNYSELMLVKNIFIGEENEAIQVFPSKKDKINDHPYCLHLWRCLEENPLPDFSLFGSI